MRIRALLTAGFLLSFLPGTAAAQEAPAGAAGGSVAQVSVATPTVLPQGVAASLDFRSIGPSRGGRVTAVAGHRDTPGTFFMGATGGGVWKTTDYGQSWRNVSDGYFATGSIGSIDVADSDANTVYVGTGSDGIRSNVIIGRGAYRSDDGGSTWTDIGLRDMGQIGAIVVHPTNSQVVWAAAFGSPFGPSPERGVYRSLDAGATWTRVLFVSERTGAIDLELNPSAPDEVYAAMWTAQRDPWSIQSGDDRESGIYKSTDAGATWHKVTEGLPSGLVGKIDLAVTPADPSRVYALVETVPAEEGLYRSNDRGETWRLVSNEQGLMRRPFYYTNVDADPSNADIVYVNNESFFRSADGGKTWKVVDTPHGDNHDMWINPDDADLYIQSNDGGANVTRDGGRTWSTQINQPTAELYQVHADDRFPYYLYAGQQDNYTAIAVPSLRQTGRLAGGEAWWEEAGGCETGPAVPKPGDANVVYSNCKGLFSVFDRRTGQERNYAVGAVDLYGANPKDLPYRFQRVVPIEVSPHDPNTVYNGSQYVHRTRDGGLHWERISPDLTAFMPERQVASGAPITRDITGEEHYSVLYVIEESPLEPSVLWTGANDGPVHVTRDDGTSWKNVTPPMPAEGRVNSIAVSAHRPGTAYVAAYRTLLNDFRPYAFRTDDYGETWTLLTDGRNGIRADEPVRVVREDPVRPGLLYAGTDYGLYVSLDDGRHWESFQGDLPVVQVTDLKLKENDLLLSTMGRGFWILDDVSWLRQFTSEATSQPSWLFGPRTAIRMRTGWRPSSVTDTEMLAPGAVIWYVLREGVGALKIEILDAEGRLVREFAGIQGAWQAVGNQGVESTTPGMHGPIAAVTPAGRPGMEAGLHRFIWDLRYPGSFSRGSSPSTGPMVVPGVYTVRLTTPDRVMEQSLTVVLDPRVVEIGVTDSDLRAQLDHNLRVRDARSSLNRGIARLDSVLATIPVTAGEETAAVRDRRAAIRGLRAEAVTDNSDSYPPLRMDAQWDHLAGQTSSADQAPGQDALARFDELDAQLAAWLERVDRILRSGDG